MWLGAEALGRFGLRMYGIGVGSGSVWAYAKAAKNLVKADKLVREQRKAAALRDCERLSLPPAGEPERATATSIVVPIRAT